MQQNQKLNEVPYPVPGEAAREMVPRMVTTEAIKVYSSAPTFWAVLRSQAGDYRVQMGTVLGVGDKGYDVTPEGVADFVKHTKHLEQLLVLLKELGWKELVMELETKSCGE